MKDQEKTFNGARAFLYIPASVAHDKKLLSNPKSILLLGEITAMLNTTGRFYMSNRELAKRLDCNKSTINRYLQLLEKNRYIVRKKIKSPESGALIGRQISAGDALVSSMLLGWSHGRAYPSGTDEHTLVSPVRHKENSIKDKNNRSVNNLSLTRRETKKKSNPLNLLNEEEAEAAKLAKNIFNQWNYGEHKLSSNETRQLCLAIKGRSVSTVGKLVNKAMTLATVDPLQYFLKLMKNEPKEQAE